MASPALGVEQTHEMYRLYNKNTGEHFYTASSYERDSLVGKGWSSEGLGWVAPAQSSTPVYRLYNSHVRGGDHHYTTSEVERDDLVEKGWSYEGVGWYSDDAERMAVLRQYNPNARTGTHNYTTSATERNDLIGRGWSDEGVGWYAVEEGRAATPIMGTSSLTADDMAAYYASKVGRGTYPTTTYASKGAPDIDTFCQIVVEESEAEGVRADVVFAQAMKETGWLRFGGDVKAEQCNFAGLGATGGGVGGATFPDVRTGIRAQVQHLKAYASTEPLVNDCVDPRFHLVTRGCAPTLESLNGRWAVPGNGYGEEIAALIDEALALADR